MAESGDLADLVQRFRAAAAQQDPEWLQQQLRDLLGRSPAAQRDGRPTRRSRPPERLSPQPFSGASRRSRRSDGSTQGERQSGRGRAASTRRGSEGAMEVAQQAGGSSRQVCVRALPAAPRSECEGQSGGAESAEGDGAAASSGPQSTGAAEEGAGIGTPGAREEATALQGGNTGDEGTEVTARPAAPRPAGRGRSREGEASQHTQAARGGRASQPPAPRETCKARKGAGKGTSRARTRDTAQQGKIGGGEQRQSTGSRRDTTGAQQGEAAPNPVGGQERGRGHGTAQGHPREPGASRESTPVIRQGGGSGRGSGEGLPSNRTHGSSRPSRSRERSRTRQGGRHSPHLRSRSRSRGHRDWHEHGHSMARSRREDSAARLGTQRAWEQGMEHRSRSRSRCSSHRGRHSCCRFSYRSSPCGSERRTSHAGTPARDSRTHGRQSRGREEDRGTQRGASQQQHRTGGTRLESTVTAQGPAAPLGPGVGAFLGGGARGIAAGMRISTTALAVSECRLLEFVKASVADSTWAAYSKAWNDWRQLEEWSGGFGSRQDKLSGLVWYVVWLAEQGKSVAFIEKRMAALAFRFKLLGEEDLTKEFRIKQAVKGIKRGKRTRDSRRPISFDLLGKLQGVLPKCCRSEYEVILFRAAFALAFFGALRLGELVSKSKSVPGGLFFQDVQVTEDRVFIRLQRSKTDVLGKGKDIVLFKVDGGLACPVGCLHRFLKVRREGAEVFLIHDDKTPLTRFQFTNILKRSLGMSGVIPAEFGTHSFRIGAATEAARLGLGDHTVMQIGRWESKRFKSYIRPGLLVQGSSNA
ncbi:hypothetical protein XENTR_v10022432 [Xenopus tropicalis]|nr:hypothetical protein XENTR_v10022432 [Xenopus tropicalis]